RLGHRPRSRHARQSISVARRALYVARSSRGQRSDPVESGARHSSPQRPSAARLFGDANGSRGAPRVARHTPADVARARAPAEGADVVKAFADWLLRRALPPGEAGDTIRGDLIEGWRDRGGSRAATRWYWQEAVSLAVRYGARRRPEIREIHSDRRQSMRLDSLK